MIELASQRQVSGGRPIHIGIEDMTTPIQFWTWNRYNRETRLRGQRRHTWIVCRLKIPIFLAKIVIHVPRHSLVWLDGKQERVRLESIEVLCLVGSVNEPVLEREVIIHVVSSAKAHVVEGKVIEIVRARVVHLVIGIVVL